MSEMKNLRLNYNQRSCSLLDLEIPDYENPEFGNFSFTLLTPTSQLLTQLD